MEGHELEALALANLGVETTPSGNEGGDGGAGAPSASAQAPNPSEIFGENFKSWEDVKAIPLQLEELRGYKTKFEELSARPSAEFADEEIAEFNAFVKNTGIKDYNSFKTIKGADENLDPIEAFVLKTVIENPEFKGKEDMLRKKFIRDFGLDPSINEEEDIEMNKLTLKQKSKEVFDWLSDKKSKFSVPKVDTEALKKANAEKRGKWAEAVEKVIGSTSKLEIPFYNNGKVEVLADFEIKPEISAMYKEAFTEAFQGYDMNDKNVQNMEVEFRDRFIARNLPHIVSHALSVHEAKLRNQWEDEIAGKLEKPKSPGGGGTSSGDILDEILAKHNQ